MAFAASPNSSPPVMYCDGGALEFNVEAHGDGYSSLGALPFFLQKTFGGTNGHGCLTRSTPEGDSLFATYDLTQGDPNANNFVTDGRGTPIFTGGTGLFKGAKGKATFTPVFGQGIGFYVVDGKGVRRPRRLVFRFIHTIHQAMKPLIQSRFTGESRCPWQG